MTLAVAVPLFEIRRPTLSLVPVIRVEDHLGLVYRLASLFVDGRAEGTDEYTDGLYGLWQAVENYNPEFNVDFGAYARQCILNAIKTGRRNRKNELNKRVEVEWEEIPDKHISHNVNISRMVLSPHPDDTDRERIGKKIIEDHFIYGKTWHEIGIELGISRMAVLKRARKVLSVIRKRFGVQLAELV